MINYFYSLIQMTHDILYDAIKTRNLDILKFLFDHNVSNEISDKSIELAIKIENPKIIVLLIENHADINVIIKQAIQMGNIKLVKKVFNQINKNQMNILRMHKNHPYKIFELINPDVMNLIIKNKIIDSSDYYCRTGLLLYVLRHNNELSEIGISADANVLQQMIDDSFYSDGYTDYIKLLLKNGVEVNENIFPTVIFDNAGPSLTCILRTMLVIAEHVEGQKKFKNVKQNFETLLKQFQNVILDSENIDVSDT